MTQHIRVLSESEFVAPLGDLRRVLPSEFEIVVEEGDEENWSQLLLRHRGGAEVALIERELVAPEQLGEQELRELLRDMEGALPIRAAEWLKHYLSHVKTVYLLEPMKGADEGDGWLAVQVVQAYFWKKYGGVLQADNEGFTNREGQHVLWQFHGPQSGELEAAVMDDEGRWVAFTMNMDDLEQVAAFQRGEVPQGARRIA